jgi:hypothetical protein
MASRAVYIKSLLPVAERMAEVAPSDSERSRWQAMVKDGKGHESTYWLLAHQSDDRLGAAMMNQPVNYLRAMRDDADRWEAAALQALRALKRTDSQWARLYPGPSRKL